MSRLPFYDSIVLDESELEEAILQGKIKKYFREKNAKYWNDETQMERRPVFEVRDNQKAKALEIANGYNEPPAL